MQANLEIVKKHYKDALTKINGLAGFCMRVGDNDELGQAITAEVTSLFHLTFISDAIKIKIAQEAFVVDIKAENFREVANQLKKITAMVQYEAQQCVAKGINVSILPIKMGMLSESAFSQLPKELLFTISGLTNTCISHDLNKKGVYKFFKNPMPNNKALELPSPYQEELINFLKDNTYFNKAKRGNWKKLGPNSAIEIGISNYSGLKSLATATIQVSLAEDGHSLKVLDKKNGFKEIVGTDADFALIELSRQLNPNPPITETKVNTNSPQPDVEQEKNGECTLF